MDGHTPTGRKQYIIKNGEKDGPIDGCMADFCNGAWEKWKI